MAQSAESWPLSPASRVTKSSDGWARYHLAEAERCAAHLKTFHRDSSALYHIGNASTFRAAWSADEVARALAVTDEIIRANKSLTVKHVEETLGVHSNLGDECGARLVPHVHVPRNVFSQLHLITSIGPLTMKALLRAGADPNCGTAFGTPLARLLDKCFSAFGYPRRIQMAAVLIAAGADPSPVRVASEFVEPFQQLCALRSLAAFCAAAVLSSTAPAPVAWFLRRDGDLALVHRVHRFLASLER